MPLAAFHPTVARWFRDRVGEPSPPQVEGWPKIRSGRHTLIAAPTGTGKTLAAFLWAIDGLLRKGAELNDETSVLYVSPLKALGNDVQKNLRAPLDELQQLDPSFPQVRVLVRTGDTPAHERAAMNKRPPHILVTTPESLYILLTSDAGRATLGTVRTVIVDEIHAIAGDKRGSHLTLSLERLEALVASNGAGGSGATQDSCHETRPALQRIGLSATQKPIEDVANLLVGKDRTCETVDVGHQRTMDIAIELPDSPLETVCSTETWEEIVRKMASMIDHHRTTLVFVNTRKLAERIAAKLTTQLGEGKVTSHHGSLARERRLEAEQLLKAGKLRALVATASLELGIDIGDVDLVIQCGITPSIAVLLQRVGRSGHGPGRVPRGRLFPLTHDELVCAVGLLDAVRRGELDRTPQPGAPLDILAQQIVAATIAESWDEDLLFDTLRRAWPYRDVKREDFDSTIALLTEGRSALVHRDGVNRRLRATRRARITALTAGGAIPDTGQFRVAAEPEGITVGFLDEDFAIESHVGDIFQLGNTSWRVLKVEPGTVRVADAQGQPPSVPFWLGEAPARTRELSTAVARIREAGRDRDELKSNLQLTDAAATELSDYIADGVRSLGVIPTPECVVLERFFDESGGMQMVIHAPFGGRINRAWGLTLRKRFCRGFGYELQAAANEEAIVISLGLVHSFPLEEVFDYLHPDTARDLLVQALIDAPMFKTRWRWNLSRALLLPRTHKGGQRVPTNLLRMRAEDQLTRAFPQVLACPETLPPGETPIPWEHPLVRQTIEDCLNEAMDIDGFLDVLRGLRSGRIRRVAVDTPEPSAFARGILNAMPYTFLDDAPLEERRTQAVLQRRHLDPKPVDTLGALDPAAVERVRGEAWPDPENAEEVHEALLWMGYITEHEARESGWSEWLDELSVAGRVCLEQALDGGPAWFAIEAAREPREVLRGRLEALGPVFAGTIDERLFLELENQGTILRCRLEGQTAWCERRLLARIQRYTLEALRREIEPVTAAEFWRFLACWQHVDPAHRLDGPRGVAEVVRQLAGFEIPAGAWESSVLPMRVNGYRPDWLDELMLTGDVAWGRLWGAGNAPARATPVCLVPREDLDAWLELSALAPTTRGGDALTADARAVLAVLTSRGACFAQEIERSTGRLPAQVNDGLAQLIGHGLVTCDSFGGLRRLVHPRVAHRVSARGARVVRAGRWSLLHDRDAAPVTAPSTERIEFVARQLLARYGVVFRALIEREKLPVPWRDLARCYRLAELRGDVRGGRFVQRFSGEQYALPEAVELMRRLRRGGKLEGRVDAEPTSGRELPGTHVAAGDPLNLEGVLTPSARVSAQARRKVLVG